MRNMSIGDDCCLLQQITMNTRKIINGNILSILLYKYPPYFICLSPLFEIRQKRNPVSTRKKETPLDPFSIQSLIMALAEYDPSQFILPLK